MQMILPAGKWLRHLLSGAFALFVVAGCQAPQPPAAQPRPTAAAQAPAAPVKVVTSPNDQREYRYLVLPNHMQVLLISDPSAQKAAAALDVHVGSREDPADRPGLAHFLEHMLFLGTQRYPKAGAYQDYISSHGGDHNAFTAFDHTNYFFDVDARFLAPALDRFSQFFVAPLFTAKYVEREKHAVDSEYHANINDDGRRQFDVLKAVVNPRHPFSRFSVGSLQTLADRKGDPVRQDLLRFYHQHYSADLMTLVVIGREPLDQLQAMVTPRFGAVPDTQKTVTPVKTPLFQPQQLPALVQIQPVQRQRTLSFLWPIPDQRDDYRAKSLAYIGNIVGHEGTGSLLSYLKARGWALGLAAGEGFSYDGGSTFNVSIELTAAGAAHVDDITTALYQTLARIRDGGIQAWRYHEQHVIARQGFRYRDHSNAIADVSQLAYNLQQYAPADVLRGPTMMAAFEPDRIRALLDRLTPQHMLVTLMAPGVTTDKVSPWYHAPYSVRKIPQAEVAAWRAVKPYPAIRLPQPNEFIASRFDLKTTVGQQVDPVQLEKTGTLQLWYAPDNVFRLPKAVVGLSLRSPIAGTTPRRAVLAELLARMVDEDLDEYSYPARLAGLDYGVAASNRGIDIQLRGFDDKQSVLLTHILDTLRHPALDPARFEHVRRAYQRELEDARKQPPYQLLVDDLGDTLYRRQWPESELARQAAGVTVAELARFARQLLAAGQARMLVYGNYTAADARQLAALVSDRLLSGMRPTGVPDVNVLRLPAGELRRQVPVDHDDAGLLWYRQAGDNRIRTRAALGISAQVLAADFYGQLRTRQQLGYIVMATPYPVRDVPGLVFLVQSPVAGPAQLAHAYRDFLQQWHARDAASLHNTFEVHREALAARLAEAPKNQDQQFARFWQDLMQGHTGFDTRRRLLAAVQGLTFEQWLPLFRRDAVAPQGHALWLAVDGRFHDQGLKAGRAIGNLERFKARQHYFRFP